MEGWKNSEMDWCKLENMLATKREYKSICKRKKRQHLDSMSQHIDELQGENSKGFLELINNRKKLGEVGKISTKEWHEYFKSLHSASCYSSSYQPRQRYNFVEALDASRCGGIKELPSLIPPHLLA